MLLGGRGRQISEYETNLFYTMSSRVKKKKRKEERKWGSRLFSLLRLFFYNHRHFKGKSTSPGLPTPTMSCRKELLPVFWGEGGCLPLPSAFYLSAPTLDWHPSLLAHSKLHFLCQGCPHLSFQQRHLDRRASTELWAEEKNIISFTLYNSKGITQISE